MSIKDKCKDCGGKRFDMTVGSIAIDVQCKDCDAEYQLFIKNPFSGNANFGMIFTGTNQVSSLSGITLDREV